MIGRALVTYGLIGLLALGLVELMLRWLPKPQPTPTTPMIYLLSQPSLVRHDDGSVRGVPGSTLRYGAATPLGLIYDALYPVNAQGLFDSADYAPDPDRTDLVLLGDSTLMGQGAAPWFPGLRTELADHGIAARNLGIFGAGLLQMDTLLTVLKDELQPEAIAVLAICNDFHRRPFVPVDDRLGTRLCLADQVIDGDCADGGRRIALNWTLDEHPREGVARVAQYFERPARTIAQPASSASGMRALYHRMRANSALVQRLDALRLQRAYARSIDELESQSLGRLKQWVDDYGADRVRLIWYSPEVNWLQAVDAARCERLIERSAQMAPVLDLRAACGLTQADLHVHDPHLNAAGYQKLHRCVADGLRDWMAARP